MLSCERISAFARNLTHNREGLEEYRKRRQDADEGKDGHVGARRRVPAVLEPPCEHEGGHHLQSRVGDDDQREGKGEEDVARAAEEVIVDYESARSSIVQRTLYEMARLSRRLGEHSLGDGRVIGAEIERCGDLLRLVRLDHVHLVWRALSEDVAVSKLNEPVGTVLDRARVGDQNARAASELAAHRVLVHVCAYGSVEGSQRVTARSDEQYWSRRTRE